ncbi:MAG: MATE family efflux transporter [Lachnospiraceae bacterium]|nr:MATE family efflux transporter [Lachnospiraceae bacterium]
MASERDLTTGNITKQLLGFILPLSVTSVLQSLYGMADMAIAGYFIGNTGLSAITNGETVMNMVTKIVIGLSLGGSVLIGQFFGNKDEKNRMKATGTFITFFFLLGITASILLFFMSGAILKKIGAPAFEDALRYLQICSIGVFFIFGYNCFSGIIRALGNSKSPLVFIAVSAAINVFLDYILVVFFNLGTAGTAWATVASQAVSFVMALVYILKNSSVFKFCLENLKIELKKLKTILKLGIPCAIQMTVAAVSWLVVLSLVNDYGVDVSAGCGASAKIRDFCTLFIHSISSGAAAMIAQNLGAKEYGRSKEILYTAMKMSVAFAVLTIVAVELTAPYLIEIFTHEAYSISVGVLNLRIEIIGQIFYAIFIVYHALPTGAGHTWVVFLSSFVNCILVRIVLATLFNRYFGLTGIFVACMIAPSSSIIVGLIYERSNVWRRSLVEDKKC